MSRKVMSLRDLWAKNPENKRSLRPKTRQIHSDTESSGSDKMAESGDIENLVTRTSDGVFTKINSSLDKKLDETEKSASSVCEKI